ncbi:hypothetical protein BCR42DRAFT_140245 [Absidia repens]|uniref:RING-type E3 ubiquitin transferase n=1 Tax=Absidia repens TaxID=90262 RepID=A0A1X2I3H2_9FUNG|nr:hypothetical protein BCR42DRAFT_140245 [Absidia repens]
MTLEICRVCRCESTLAKPLYHPCKCTGSIRFIHQDCLLEWLAHSRNDYCELCEHLFEFTPVYRQDMPAHIPIYLLIRQCLLHCGTFLKIGLRGVAVGVVWLMLLPYMILWSWRLCFPPSVNIGVWYSDETQLSSRHDQQHPYGSSYVEYGLREVLVDCFKGQVITMVLILVVAATYILREWMAQNIPLEADQESETDQTIEAPSNIDRIYTNAPRQHQLHDNYSEADNDTISILTQQQTAVDTLLNALNELDDDGTSTKNEGNDLRKQLEDLQHDLRQEVENTQQPHHQGHHDLQQDRQQHHAHHQLDNDFNTTIAGNGWMNSDGFQLNTDDDDETQVENMMQSIMVQDPANFSTRYSWDDLRNNNNFPNRYYKQQQQQQQQQQSLCLKRDSLRSSSLFLDSSTALALDNKISSITNCQLLESAFKSGTTVGNDLQNHQFTKPPISACLLQNTNVPKSTSEIPPSSKNKYHHIIDNAEDTFSRSKSSTPLAYEHSPAPSQQVQQLQQQYVIEKTDQDELSDTNQSLDINTIQNISTENQRAQPIDTNDEVLDDDDEDGIFNLGDDLDGVLQAIGMRGNPWGLLQNSILAFIIISCCLGVSVCIPYILGRLIIMIHPISFIEKIIGALRYVTDPIVDYALDYWLPSTDLVTNGLDTLIHLFVPNGVLMAGWSLLEDILTAAIPLFKNYDAISSNVAPPSTSSPLSLKYFRLSAPDNILSGNNGTAPSMHRQSMAIQQTLAMTGINTIHAINGKIIERWHQLAVGQSGLDRGVCTIIGYIALLCICSWYLAFRRHRQDSITNDRLPTQQRHGTDDFVQQLGIVLKVISFVILEMGLLPLSCGCALDLVTLPLVENQSIFTRWIFAKSYPYWSCFLHWFVGTCFIHETAVFVSLCRETTRPGVMWFIRNTNDPNFKPIQEIMECPFFECLQNLCSAVVIYLAFIVGGIGSVILLVSRYTGIQHLRWTFSEPLTSVATDILAAQFLLPILVTHIKPRDSVKQTLSMWWHAISHQLRLSSFMFGERYPREEGDYINKTWNSWISYIPAPNAPYLSTTGNDDNSTTLFQMDGNLVRVPNQDTVKSHPQQRMIIPVETDTLEPITPSERISSGQAAIGQNRNEEDDTTVVYIPPHFKARVALFLVLMWLCGSVMACSLTVVPLLFGRFILDNCITHGKQLHDVYAYVFGVCAMVLSTNSLRSIARGTNYLKQDGGLFDLLDKLSACVRQKTLNSCKILYLTFMIGCLIPLLMGLAVDLYVFAPFRSNTPSSQLVLTLDLFSNWNYGLVYLGIMYRLAYILPTNTWKRGIDQYMMAGLSSLNTWTLTRTVFAPWIIGTACAIVIPGGSAWIVLHLLGVQDASMELLMLRYVYVGVLCTAAITVVVMLGMKLVNLWMRIVRDDTYLVGRQLHNFQE